MTLINTKVDKICLYSFLNINRKEKKKCEKTGFVPCGSSQSVKRFLNCFNLSGVWAPIGLLRSRNVAGFDRSNS